MKIKDFLDDLMPRLPGAEESLVIHETLATVRRFCEEGTAWTMKFGPLRVREGNAIVYLDPLPCNTRVGYVLSVFFNEVSRSSGPRRMLAPMACAPFPGDEATGAPMAFYMVDSGVMQLTPIPDRDYGRALYVDISVIPMSADVELPSTFQTHFRDAIIDGVCSRMLGMPSKPWTSLTLAQAHGQSFKNHIKRARDITRRGYSTSSATWRYPKQFMGR